MYGLYDQSRLLQPSGEFFLWSLPIPFENFYPLAPPPPRALFGEAMLVPIQMGTNMVAESNRNICHWVLLH